MILFFDTETTGKANFAEPPAHPSQPHVVQLGALLTDDLGKELSVVDMIVKPAIEIPEVVANIHGISDALARQAGIAPKVAALTFEQLLSQADLVVAHNDDFDHLVMAGEFARHELTYPTKKRYCTMKATTNICKIPGKFPGRYKWPKLAEAYKHFFNEDLVGAHNAMVDVRACARIYFHVKQ